MYFFEFDTAGNSLRGSLPQVGSSKSLDVYVVTCLIYAFAALIEYAVLGVTTVKWARRKNHQVCLLWFRFFNSFSFTVKHITKHNMLHKSFILNQKERSKNYILTNFSLIFHFNTIPFTP